MSAFGSNTSTSNHSHSWPFYGGRWEATLSSTLGQPQFTLPSFFFLHTRKVLRQTGFFFVLHWLVVVGENMFLACLWVCSGNAQIQAFVLNAISKIAFALRVRESHNWNGIACISFGIIKCYGIQAVFLQLKCLLVSIRVLAFIFLCGQICCFVLSYGRIFTYVGWERNSHWSPLEWAKILVQ